MSGFVSLQLNQTNLGLGPCMKELLLIIKGLSWNYWESLGLLARYWNIRQKIVKTKSVKDLLRVERSLKKKVRLCKCL